MKFINNVKLSGLIKWFTPLIIGAYKKQYSINTSISNVWEEIRGLSGYSDCEVSNIHKKNDGTWHFTFSLLKSRFSKIMSNTIVGRAYSKDDSLTIIEIKYGSTVSSIYLMAAVSIISFIGSYIGDNLLNITTIIILIFCILGAYIHAYHREAKSNLIDFVEKMKLEEASEVNSLFL